MNEELRTLILNELEAKGLRHAELADNKDEITKVLSACVLSVVRQMPLEKAYELAEMFRWADRLGLQPQDLLETKR